jgi:hypothetical protein
LGKAEPLSAAGEAGMLKALMLVSGWIEILTWPELIPFFEGVAEEIGIKCKIEGDLRELGEGGRYECFV